MSNTAGSLIEVHAIVLSVLPLKEADRLVHLITPEQGRITALALKAARSQKRFGAALEPMNHVKAHLRVPRDQRSGETPLWQLEKTDLQNSFLHFRNSYESLESAFFVLKLLLDIVPEGTIDAGLFKALGRFLRDSDEHKLESYPSWARLAFWTWLAHHLGFGDLSESAETLLGQKNKQLVQIWHACLARPEPDFKTLFQNLAAQPPASLDPRQERFIYERWVNLSGIHWKYFEQWLSSRKY